MSCLSLNLFQLKPVQTWPFYLSNSKSCLLFDHVIYTHESFIKTIYLFNCSYSNIHWAVGRAKALFCAIGMYGAL